MSIIRFKRNQQEHSLGHILRLTELTQKKKLRTSMRQVYDTLYLIISKHYKMGRGRHSP